MKTAHRDKLCIDLWELIKCLEADKGLGDVPVQPDHCNLTTCCLAKTSKG